jgi:hypothetical protein
MRNYFYLILLPLLALATSCEIVINDEHVGDLPNNNIVTYPLENGNRWVYQRLKITENYDSYYKEFTYDTVQTTVVTRVEKDTILKGNTQVKKVATREIETNNLSYAYMALEKDLLITYAMSGDGDAFAFARSSQKQQNNDVDYFDPPLVNLAFPLLKWERWIYSPRNDDGWIITGGIDKEVMDIVNFQVPAGVFKSAKILYHFMEEGDEDFYLCDYVAKEGLIKRHIKNEKEYFFDYMGNQLEDYVQTSEIYTLKEYYFAPKE